MSWLITPSFSFDTDAASYITAVETADGQALETATRYAINNFVIGCKQDGIWSAIKASCILAGARTLQGALVPLVGAAPTNFNFVAGDYSRKTGLVGNGSSKYLNSNRNNNADPQNSKHVTVFCTTAGQSGSSYFGAGVTQSGAEHYRDGNTYVLININTYLPLAGLGAATGLIGGSRFTNILVTKRVQQNNYLTGEVSGTPFNGNILIFARGTSPSPGSVTNARLAFYSIGESLDLAKLDARVTDLINAFAAAIP